MDELLAGVPAVFGEVGARLELDDHRHHHALHAGGEKPEPDPLGGRRKGALLRLANDVGVCCGLERDEIGEVDPVERHEADESSDRDVALSVLDEREERRRDAGGPGDVTQGQRLCLPGGAER